MSKQVEAPKKNTSLRLAPEILKALKIVAIHEDTSVQKIIESLVNGFLAQRKIDTKSLKKRKKSKE